ncbi:MAG TPA: helix-hairpin-helix domain-containing protein [Candidatus Paceibacterota bacterium]
MAKKRDYNKELAGIFLHTADLLEINSVRFKPAAYRKAARALEALDQDVAAIYEESGLKGLEAISGVGKSISEKIEEYLKKKKIPFYEELKEKTALREIVTHFFETKDISIKQLKMNARKQKIIYARYTAPAKQLLELAGSVEKAKKAIDIVAAWANTRGLDYTIETVAKKWLELDRLKPKEVVKKAFYRDMPMIWSEAKKKWYVIRDDGEWLEFAGDEKDIEWRIIK